MINSNKLAAFCYYLKERENIRLKKEAGEPWPWTGDKILQTYSFTNVKRANDRTTRELVTHYRTGYNGKNDEELLYNCAIGRYFGTSGFAQNVGWLKEHQAGHICNVAKRMRKVGEQVFTGAYIVTSGGQSGPKEKLVAKYLGGLWKNVDHIIAVMTDLCTWQSGYDAMRSLPGFGGSGFMTKEVLQDFLLITKLPIDDADSWTPMGPGGRRGINRMHGRNKDYRQSEEAFIGECQDLWKQLRGWWKDNFPKSGALTAHDVQFCLCEFDKYERTRTKQGRPRSKYTPPTKQKELDL